MPVLPAPRVAFAAAGELRLTEPILSGYGKWRRCDHATRAGHVVEETACGALTLPSDLVSIESNGCRRLMRNRQDATRLLAYAPTCTGAAVAMLEALAAPRRDVDALSDLAAAYFVRAQRDDRPEDLVRALDAADRALGLDSRKTEARFNRALALESLGLEDEARRTWDALRRELPPQWREEAEGHWRRLARAKTLSAAVQWPLNQQRLPEAVQAGDQAAVTELVRPYRTAAIQYVEDKLLPAWAAAASAGRKEEAADALTTARMIGQALASLTGDRYLQDSVEQIRQRPREQLREGCLALGAARNAERNLREAGDLYRKAEIAFQRAGSPLRFGAALGRARSLLFLRDYDGALALFADLQRDAEPHGYSYVLARVQANRGFCHGIQSRLFDAIADYGHAQAIYERMRDDDGLMNVHTRKLGIFRRIGHEPSIWRELALGHRHSSAMIDPQNRHLLLGESALSAVQLGYPGVGLLYQQAAVALIEDELAHNQDEKDLDKLRANLGVALRGRASLRLRLGDFDGAAADLDRAEPLIGALDDASAAILSGFRARIAEIQAQTLAPKDRRRAIAALDEAIAHASQTNYRSLVASLLLQRSELHLLEHDRPAGLRDLETAVAALQDEQRAVIAGGARLQGQEEKLWSAYFARSQDAYRRLIRQLIEDGSQPAAFDHAERARAYEPLHLVMQRSDLPADFRARIQGEEPLHLADVERSLPANTVVLQYAVLDDRTYVWIVRNSGAELVTLPVGEPQIAAWTAALQQLAEVRDTEGFEQALAAPYDGLLTVPLAKIARRSGGDPPTLVFIPDRSMHGLPFVALKHGSRYLIQDYTVAVAGSATLYAYSLAQDRQQPFGAESVLLISDPAFARDTDVARGLQPLRGARMEAERVARIYEPEVAVTRRSGEQATVAEFFRLARRSAVIHIAVHGISSADEPSGSFFLFAPDGSDSGALDVERLLKLRLDHPRLAVLSACSSAGGAPVGPEGLAPLVRPMIAAGVPGVMGTLWDVSDNPATVELLVRFHRHYRGGANADDALRMAQNEMLADPDLERRSAIAWAPFQFVGFASSPFRARAQTDRR